MIGWQVKTIGAALVVAAIAFFCWSYHHRGVRIEELEAVVAATKSANASQLETINQQSAALDEWVKVAGSPADLAELVKSAHTAKAKAEQTVRDLRAAKEKDRDLVDCMALLRISLKRTCPSISAGLFKLSRGQDGSGEGAGAGLETTAGRTDEGLRPALPIPE